MKIVLSGNPTNRTEILKKMLNEALKPINGEISSTEHSNHIYASKFTKQNGLSDDSTVDSESDTKEEL
jgi:hypothetical protein